MTALSYSRILGANDRIGLGAIGLGVRGSYVMSLFQKNADVEVRALCDVYGDRINRALEKAPEAKTFNNHRELLLLKEVDAVLIATPDHWHKDIAVDAMNFAKDVYSEKPMCRTRDEAPVMLHTARATGRVCQIGLQQRSGQVYLEAKEKYVASGLMGKIGHIDAVWHESAPRRPMSSEPAQKPDNLDWLRFLGNVRYRDWVPAQYFHFRSFLDFNGGKMTDYGHHWMDVVHMYMGETAPRSVVFAGGIFYDMHDGRTAPDTCNAVRIRRVHRAVPVQRVWRGCGGIWHDVLRRQGQAFREPQSLRVYAAGQGRAAGGEEIPRRYYGGPRAQFSGLHEVPQTSERGYVDRQHFDSAATARRAIV